MASTPEASSFLGIPSRGGPLFADAAIVRWLSTTWSLQRFSLELLELHTQSIRWMSSRGQVDSTDFRHTPLLVLLSVCPRNEV
jgi:hypothetical protein